MRGYLVVPIVGVLLFGGLVGCGSDTEAPETAAKSPENVEVEAKFYATLANAARQQHVRLDMYRETFATEADAVARKDVGITTSSVSEVNTESRQFRSVFATNILRDHGFSLGRCHDKTTYVDDYAVHSRDTPRTVTESASRLNIAPRGDLYSTNEPSLSACRQIGLMPTAVNIPMSRLSDGLIPVTLTEPQAANWARQVQAAKLFTIKDEGTVNRNGATLRKYSFTPRKDDYTVNSKLFTIYHTAGEVERKQREYPGAQITYEFLSINPQNTGGIGGFYLFDETTNLPVYSELYGTNRDKLKPPDPNAAPGRGAFHNIARTKQTYSFPAGQMTIDTNTPLTYLN